VADAPHPVAAMMASARDPHAMPLGSAAADKVSVEKLHHAPHPIASVIRATGWIEAGFDVRDAEDQAQVEVRMCVGSIEKRLRFDGNYLLAVLRRQVVVAMHDRACHDGSGRPLRDHGAV